MWYSYVNTEMSKQIIKIVDISSRYSSKGAYIKYVGGGAGGFYKFFKKNFEAQVTIDLKYFLAQ